MRASALRAIAAVSLVAAPLAAQQHLAPSAPVAAVATAPAPELSRWVGVYRLTFTDGAGSLFDARVLVEPVGDRVVGTLVVDQQASGINAISVDGDALRARIVAQEGRGELVLRESGDGVAGTLTMGKRSWQVTGARAF